MSVLFSLLFACSHVPAAPAPSDVVLHHVRLPGATSDVDVRVAGGRIAAIAPHIDGAGPDLHGAWVVPAAIDSHVHLAYLPVAERLAARGVGAVVDLAAPSPWLARRPATPRVLASGPMLTGVRGYPTQSWGRDGYGLEVADPAAATRGVAQVLDAGAGVVKLAITGTSSLDLARATAATRAAHARGVKVLAHALGDADAALAAAAGVDVLAHTPVDPLHPTTIAAWRGRTVISTLAAFGGSAAAVDNLRRLREGGVTVLYGTDLGNTSVVGVQPEEIGLLQDAGLDGAAILSAVTTVPARCWGWDDLGRVEPGAAASLLVVDADPRVDPSALARPLAVWIDGVAVR